MIRVAVVGGGIAGVACADALAGFADVTLIEGAAQLGGHTDTHELSVDGVAGVDRFGIHRFQSPQLSGVLRMARPAQSCEPLHRHELFGDASRIGSRVRHGSRGRVAGTARQRTAAPVRADARRHPPLLSRRTGAQQRRRRPDGCAVRRAQRLWGGFSRGSSAADLRCIVVAASRPGPFGCDRSRRRVHEQSRHARLTRSSGVARDRRRLAAIPRCVRASLPRPGADEVYPFAACAALRAPSNSTPKPGRSVSTPSYSRVIPIRHCSCFDSRRPQSNACSARSDTSRIGWSCIRTPR